MFGSRAAKTNGSHRPANATGLQRLDLAELHFAVDMPAGRHLDLPGRGTVFVREAPGPAGAPTVLLVHGLLASADLNWSLAVPALAAKFRVIAPDLRGHGDGIPTRRFAGAQCADDLAAIVERLELGRVIVVGYSLGGLVAQLFSRRHPEMLRGLVLCASAHSFASAGGGSAMRLMTHAAQFAPKPWRRAAMMAVLAPRSSGHGQGRWVMDQVAKHDTRAILQAAIEAVAFDSAEWLGSVVGPSAVVLTTGDQVVSPAVQRELCRVLANPVVHEVDGDHFVCVKRPEAFNVALIAACSGCAGG
ncbi:MAG TPA: alpha/beta hydrolase [Candidatus Nitrosopolaris sp.]|nr:alpha/beta hydrolase [Candidatus Nitrosopolaris sp.]